MNTWFKGFIPRSDSRLVFLAAMLCYQTLIAEVMSDVVSGLHLWPTVVDPVTHVTRPARPGIDEAGIWAFFLVPVVETLMLVGIIQLLRYFKLDAAFQVIGSALVFSLLHSLEIPIWGLLVFPFFALDAVTFVYWRSSSVSMATLMAFALHLLSNAIPNLHILARHVSS